MAHFLGHVGWVPQTAVLVAALVQTDRVGEIVGLVENVTLCACDASVNIIILPTIGKVCQNVEEAVLVALRRRQGVGSSVVNVEVEHIGEVGSEVEVLVLSAQTETTLILRVGVTDNGTVVFCDASVTVQVLELNLAGQSGDTAV